MRETERTRFAKITEGLASRDREIKIWSIASIGILRIPEHADLLTDLLASPDEEVVKAVLQSLGTIGNSSSVKYILEFVTGDNPVLAEHAVTILASFDLKEVLDVFLKVITPDRPPVLRRKLLALIAAIKDPRVLACVNEVIGTTQDPGLLTEAVAYFIRFPSPDRRTVLRMLAGSGQWEVAMTANLALSRLHDEPARSHLKRLAKSPAHPIRLALVNGVNKAPMIEDRDLYEIFFHDQHPQIRLQAHGGWHLFSPDERFTLLHEWLKREKEESVYFELLQLASKEKDTRYYEVFLKLLGDASEPLKKLARNAVVAMGSQILPRLMSEFPKMSLVLREQMLLILGSIGGGDSVVALIGANLSSSERWLKLNAIEALSLMKVARFAERFADMAKNENDVWIRATLISALTRFPGQKYLDLFQDELKHPDGRVRANAVEGFRSCKDRETRRMLEPYLHDANDRVRVNAALTLWKMGDGSVINSLIAMTKDSTKWVKSSAAFALGEIGDSEGTQALLGLLGDPEEVVYRNTLEALGKIGDIRALIPLLKERDKKRLPEEDFTRIFQRFSEKFRTSE